MSLAGTACQARRSLGQLKARVFNYLSQGLMVDDQMT